MQVIVTFAISFSTNSNCLPVVTNIGVPSKRFCSGHSQAKYGELIWHLVKFYLMCDAKF